MEMFSLNSQFGDYLILNFLRETDISRTWLGKQLSVGRLVLIDELKAEAIGQRDSFLADIRTKAAVEHPFVGSIYEARTDRGTCFFAYELLPGDSVAEIIRTHRKYKALVYVNLLRRIAEANLYHETHQNATSPLGPDDIQIDNQDIVRIKNLAVHGERSEDQSVRDIVSLASFFNALLEEGHPGTTRCLTLLSWMRGEHTDHYLGWAEVRDYCEQIEQQLTEPAESSAIKTSALPKRKKSALPWIGGGAAVLLILGLGLLKILRDPPSHLRPTAAQQEWIQIEGGSYSLPDSPEFSITRFLISNQEVTIGDYAKFLQTLELLAKDSNQGIFDHPDQPSDKPDHRPDDWDALLEAAKQSKPWNGIGISLNTPVVGIDWWDAFAYAKWKKCQLPTQEQWQAALVSSSQASVKLPISAWLPVTEDTPDRTPNGILAMAGSVAEWTAEPRVSPSNPLGRPQWVVIGGSYVNPRNGALTLEWTDNRSLRRRDLGFRVCKDGS
ncbi:MAG: hypothetical protein RL346_2211 [Verrucomicrobiota bacterium]|jgi:hypothetical protein